MDDSDAVRAHVSRHFVQLVDKENFPEEEKERAILLGIKMYRSGHADGVSRIRSNFKDLMGINR